MGQPATKKPPFDGGGFTLSAVLAPGLAAAFFFLGAALAIWSVSLSEIPQLVGAFLFLLLIVTFWGALPSLVFGGLVLVVIQLLPWRERPTPVVFMFGGVAAAGLYILTAFGLAGLSPGAAMVLAPWATPDLRGQGAGQDAWLVSSLLLSGAAAGLIYARFAKRG